MKFKEALSELKRTKKEQQVTEGTEVESVRVAISLRVDLSVLNALKAQAEALHLPYQTYLNMLLSDQARRPSITDQVKDLEIQVATMKALL